MVPLMLLVGALFFLKKGFDDNRNGVTSFAASVTGVLIPVINVIKVLVTTLVNVFKSLKPLIFIIAAITFAPFTIFLLKVKVGFEVLIPILDLVSVLFNMFAIGLNVLINVFTDLIKKIPFVGEAIEGLGGVINKLGGL